MDSIEPGTQAIGICHPDWRGVRTAAHSFRVPIVESADLDADGAAIIDRATGAQVSTVVVHGMPPGTARFLSQASTAGLSTRAVHYSSPAQHGAGAAEWDQVTALLELLEQGALHRLGFAKAGVAEVIRSLGHDASFVAARPPRLPSVDRPDLGPGTHIGVFGEMFWRKNVATQLGAVALVRTAKAHLLQPIEVPYLQTVPHHVHGVMPWRQFMGLLGAVDINLYVSLAECLPLTPMESYRLGVPCLMSQTSILFRDDRDLWGATTVGELDNPSAVAVAAERLLAQGPTVVPAANAWLDIWDATAAETWDRFVG